MVNTILTILLGSIGVFVTAQIAPGVHLNSFGTALVVAVLLGLFNSFIRPLLLLITLPINILTLGLFTFVIMGFMVWLVALIVPGFDIAGFGWAMLFAIILAAINGFLNLIVPNQTHR